MYALIQQGKPLTILGDDKPTADDLTNDYDITAFADQDWVTDNPDPADWPDGTAALANIRIEVPQGAGDDEEDTDAEASFTYRAHAF